MAQVTGHEVDGKGDHWLTLDDGRKIHVPYRKELDGAGWGDVLTASGEGSIRDGIPPAKPKGKTRSG